MPRKVLRRAELYDLREPRVKSLETYESLTRGIYTVREIQGFRKKAVDDRKTERLISWIQGEYENLKFDSHYARGIQSLFESLDDLGRLYWTGYERPWDASNHFEKHSYLAPRVPPLGDLNTVCLESDDLGVVSLLAELVHPEDLTPHLIQKLRRHYFELLKANSYAVDDILVELSRPEPEFAKFIANLDHMFTQSDALDPSEIAYVDATIHNVRVGLAEEELSVMIAKLAHQVLERIRNG